MSTAIALRLFNDVMMNIADTDRAQYDSALSVSELLITPAQVSVLKLALSLHIYSPKVEMYSQMALERGVYALSCPIAADVAGKLTCCVKKMKKLIAQSQVKIFYHCMNTVCMKLFIYGIMLIR
jgi:UDP-glucose:glycoprotein glucosyltransferase